MSIPGAPRCNCWQRSNNTFRRFVTTLVSSERHKRIPTASSSRAGLRTSSTGTRQTSRTPRDSTTSQHVSGQGTGSSSVQVWEYDKWLTEDPKGHCDRKALQILQIYKACGHLDDPGTTIFEQGTLRSTLSKANIHVNKSEQSVSMICKLVESVNRLCMLLATTKYMDDLPKDTLGKAKEATRRRSTLCGRPVKN